MSFLFRFQNTQQNQRRRAPAPNLRHITTVMPDYQTKKEGRQTEPHSGFALGELQANEALTLLKREAKCGNASAASMLAEVYARGIGVTRNLRHARLWARAALAANPSLVPKHLLELLEVSGN
jgi:TPR repeat protein